MIFFEFHFQKGRDVGCHDIRSTFPAEKLTQIRLPPVMKLNLRSFIYFIERRMNFIIYYLFLYSILEQHRRFLCHQGVPSGAFGSSTTFPHRTTQMGRVSQYYIVLHFWWAQSFGAKSFRKVESNGDGGQAWQEGPGNAHLEIPARWPRTSKGTSTSGVQIL